MFEFIRSFDLYDRKHKLINDTQQKIIGEFWKKTKYEILRQLITDILHKKDSLGLGVLFFAILFIIQYALPFHPQVNLYLIIMLLFVYHII
jgi:hypothetical protein